MLYYFVIITSVMMPYDDPGETNHPYLRVGYHRWYQRITDTSCPAIFSKIYDEETLK
jgi:hypothetical protein